MDEDLSKSLIKLLAGALQGVTDKARPSLKTIKAQNALMDLVNSGREDIKAHEVQKAMAEVSVAVQIPGPEIFTTLVALLSEMGVAMPHSAGNDQFPDRIAPAPGGDATDVVNTRWITYGETGTAALASFPLMDMPLVVSAALQVSLLMAMLLNDEDLRLVSQAAMAINESKSITNGSTPMAMERNLDTLMRNEKLMEILRVMAGRRNEKLLFDEEQLLPILKNAEDREHRLTIITRIAEQIVLGRMHLID